MFLNKEMMAFQFKIIPNEDLDSIIPLVFDLNMGKVDKTLLKSRFNEMKEQNYKCAGVFENEKLVGVSGLWFCTRHYMGKTVELDHVYIKPEYRGTGLGRKFMKWLYDYVKEKGCNSAELNTYVQNFPSHKFYYNEGFEIWGYHFLKQL